MQYEHNGYLVHHGIKGQKWGIRRYQNENGTLTPEGKERYNKDSNFRYRIERERINKRYEASQNKIKDQYRSGQITKKQYENRMTTSSVTKSSAISKNKALNISTGRMLATSAIVAAGIGGMIYAGSVLAKKGTKGIKAFSELSDQNLRALLYRGLPGDKWFDPSLPVEMRVKNYQVLKKAAVGYQKAGLAISSLGSTAAGVSAVGFTVSAAARASYRKKENDRQKKMSSNKT